MARAPRWTRWKSFGTPSIAEYIAIGETTMRLGSVTPRIVIGREHRRRHGPFGVDVEAGSAAANQRS